MNDNIISAGKLMEILFSNLNVEDSSRAASISSEWKKIVSKIKSSPNIDEKRNDNLGNNISDHSKIVDLKNGVLLIETDHSGWIQYLRTYQKFILNGLKKELPDLNITSLAFRQSGSNVNLYNSYEEQMKNESKQFYEKIENQERKIADETINKTEKNDENENECTLPPEMLAKFDSIRNSVLTNSKFK